MILPIINTKIATRRMFFISLLCYLLLVATIKDTIIPAIRQTAIPPVMAGIIAKLAGFIIKVPIV